MKGLRLYQVILGLAACTVLGIAVAMIAPLYSHRNEGRRKLENASRAVSEYKAVNEQRRKTLDGLETDRDVIEKVARETYHYSREGETIIIYKRDGENLSSAPANAL